MRGGSTVMCFCFGSVHKEQLSCEDDGFRRSENVMIALIVSLDLVASVFKCPGQDHSVSWKQRADRPK